MPILLQCPQCKARMKAPDGSEGRKAKCPRCGTLIPILAADTSPEGGEEDVKGDEDAGLFSATKKPPTKKRDSVPAKDVTIRKGRKIVEDDEAGLPNDNVTEDEDDDNSTVGLQDDPDDDDEEEEDRPRKKKKKKKRRRRSSASDVDPALIDNGWNMIKYAFGIGVFGMCCCWPTAIGGACVSLAAVGIGFTVMAKGDAATGGAQILLGVLALGLNMGDVILGFIFMSNELNK